MAESDAAYDTLGLSLFLLSAENFCSLGRVKKRRGGAGAAAAARAKISSSPGREGPCNPEGPPALSETPGVEKAAAARAAVAGRGRVRAEEAEPDSSCTGSSGSGSNATDCGSSLGCCGKARLGSFVVVVVGGAHSPTVDS